MNKQLNTTVPKRDKPAISTRPLASMAGALRRAVAYVIGAAIGFALIAGLLWLLAMADVMGLAIGVLFGVMAGQAVAVLVLAGRGVAR